METESSNHLERISSDTIQSSNLIKKIYNPFKLQGSPESTREEHNLSEMGNFKEIRDQAKPPGSKAGLAGGAGEGALNRTRTMAKKHM